jgi:hypothetical protein
MVTTQTRGLASEKRTVPSSLLLMACELSSLNSTSLRVYGLGLSVQGSGFRVQGVGLGVWG